MDVAHVGLVHRDPCECKVKGFRAVSSIERNVSKRRHLQGVRQVVIKVEKDHCRLEEERRARRIVQRTAREAKEKEMTDAVAASQVEVAEMKRRQAETDRKQQALERQMAELMARMNP